MPFRHLALVAVLLCAFAAHAQLPDAPNLAMSDPPEVPKASFGIHLAPVRMASTLAPEPLAPRKVIDGKFIALMVLTFTLTAVDVEMTQRCLAARTCYEMNPTLPDSRAGMYAINTATNLAVTYLSYRRRKAGKRDWWIAPVIDIGAHGVGIGTNVRFVGK